MNRELAFQEINETQDFYVGQLIEALCDPSKDCFKEQNFTSDTGTGKTKMMAKLCNRMPDTFFVITTLSKGQLQNQVRASLAADVKQNNFVVYGLCDFTANTKRQAEDIIAELPTDKRIVWLRDEGHINTNRWQEIINNRCWKIVNISATNKEAGIRCNFTHTMMLRTVHQQEGTPEEALDKLLEVKKQHKTVKRYNPCAIMRCLDSEITNRVIKGCKERNLKYINITEEDFDMSALCEDDNEYDVIINKFKIVEGIDLRRAHVIYMTNEPSNISTTIQIIGRCRRNALLYRKDVNIFAKTNKKLLERTRQCFVYYNVVGMSVDSDENGNLCPAFCDRISCEMLKVGSKIHVEKGIMENGLLVIELSEETGDFIIEKDEETGFNVVFPENNFYSVKTEKGTSNYIYQIGRRRGGKKIVSCYDVREIKEKLKVEELTEKFFDFSVGEKTTRTIGLGYKLDGDSVEPVTVSCVKKIPKNISADRTFFNNYILLSQLENIESSNPYYNYTKIVNDKNSAIIGTDLMKSINSKSGRIWIEDKAVTSKISKYSKLNMYIQNKYLDKINQVKDLLYKNKRNFSFDKKCNSCLGYCVEYYGKYLVYGDLFLKNYIEQAQHESHTTKKNTFIIVRACMLMYKDMMIKAFGPSVERMIPTMTVSSLMQEKYFDFVQKVVEFGENVANFIKTEFNISAVLQNGDKIYDPNLSIEHISGLADFITKDKIVDIKCTGEINLTNIKQVLTYHYLSTKRSDLDIKEVIVFDAINNKSVKVKV